MTVYDLSYDPRDPFFDIPGLPGAQWGLQVFTTGNVYGLNPDRVQMTGDSQDVHLVCDGLSWGGQQQRAEGRVEAHLSRQGNTWSWQITAQHAEPLKVVKLMLRGLPEDALSQGWWQPTSAAGDPQAVRTDFGAEHINAANEVWKTSRLKPLRWRYPWPEWLTPWTCAGEVDSDSFVCVSVRDPEVRAKRLYVHQPPYNDGAPIVELIFEEDAARWRGEIETPVLRLGVYTRFAEVEADFEAHLAFLESAYNLQPWETRPDVPAWMRNIRLVLNLHGQHWTGYVFNTFDRMAEAVRLVAQHIPGEQVLAYIPGWEGRYYYAYPNYRPGPDLGGEAAFRRLLATASELGVKVMPMFGMHGANVQAYPDWERSAFRSRTNSYVKLVNCPDWDTDRAGEEDQVFLNPGEPTFRQHLLEQVSAVVRDYDVPGVFLDTSACWFNDPRFNLFEGYRLLIDALHGRHPDLLIAGEGWWDGLLGVLPVNQSWLGVNRQYRFPQLMTRYARALGHLAEGAPGPVEYGRPRARLHVCPHANPDARPHPRPGHRGRHPGKIPRGNHRQLPKCRRG